MAVGKGQQAKKGAKRKGTDPFLRKDWYDVQAPAYFTQRFVGKTPVNRTQGTKTSEASLSGRVFTISLGDLTGEEDLAFRKFKLQVLDIQDRNCLTQFYGMDFTTDKLRSLVRKWHTLIDATVDVKTSDGYLLRLFAIAFTKRRSLQIKKSSYAKKSQERRIRKKMMDIISETGAKSDLRELVKKLTLGTIGKEIEKQCAGIYPLQNCFVRKVKLLKAPKFELGRLMEAHATKGEDVGEAVAK